MSSIGRAERLPVFVLSAPWSIFDVDLRRHGTGRQQLSTVKPVIVRAGLPIYVAAPEQARLTVDGRRLGAERETEPFELGHRRYTLHSISIGTRDDDANMTVRLDGERAGSVKVVDHLPRPSWSLGRESTAPTTRHQERLDLYLLGLVDLIRLVDDPSVAWHETGWARLLHAWTGEEINLSEPPMALIVRHASVLQRLLNDLGRHPRRILSRTRAMTLIDRVQQLDVASVRWLSRQPGQTVYQRAGPKQRILSVQRFEDMDTLENRVLRDLGLRSNELAAAYTERYRHLQKSVRWQVVDSYRRDTQRLARNLQYNDVGLPHPPIVPNYALLQDRRYRRVWRAYREIIRHLDEQDECWRWQHRLWADFCRLAIQLGLGFRQCFRLLAESPLRISEEQQRGRWSQVDAHSGVFILNGADSDPRAVISVIWDTTSAHAKLASWMSGLGVAAVLHIQNLQDGKESFILIWPIHNFGVAPCDLEEMATSANRALEECLRQIALADNVRIRAEGLILASSFDPDRDSASPPTRRVGSALAVRLNAGFGRIREDIDTIGLLVETLVKRLLSEDEDD